MYPLLLIAVCIQIDTLIIYSYLSVSTGFFVAAFMIWKLIVTAAIKKADNPEIINTFKLISTLKANPWSQLFITTYATGHANKFAVTTNINIFLETRLSNPTQIIKKCQYNPWRFWRPFGREGAYCNALPIISCLKSRMTIE